MNVPKISVIMGAFNCERTIAESVESIRVQTAQDWELIICDDGSTDGTWSYMTKISAADERIKVLRNKRNLGLSHALNACMALAEGKYFARMDADDISEPARLEKLCVKLDSCGDISFVSSWMTAFDEAGEWGVIKSKEWPDAMDFIKGPPYCHAPSMFRREAILGVGGYNTSAWVRRVEDYDLWFRLHSEGHRGMNIQEPLYRVRDDRHAEVRRAFKARLNEALVRYSGYKLLRLPWWSYVWVLRPILVWAMPAFIYRHWRRNRLAPRAEKKA